MARILNLEAVRVEIGTVLLELGNLLSGSESVAHHKLTRRNKDQFHTDAVRYRLRRLASEIGAAIGLDAAALGCGAALAHPDCGSQLRKPPRLLGSQSNPNADKHHASQQPKDCPLADSVPAASDGRGFLKRFLGCAHWLSPPFPTWVVA
jgi:hypothetical protein